MQRQIVESVRMLPKSTKLHGNESKVRFGKSSRTENALLSAQRRDSTHTHIRKLRTRIKVYLVIYLLQTQRNISFIVCWLLVLVCDVSFIGCGIVATVASASHHQRGWCGWASSPAHCLSVADKVAAAALVVDDDNNVIADAVKLTAVTYSNSSA